jgi:hypothetical protein
MQDDWRKILLMHERHKITTKIELIAEKETVVMPMAVRSAPRMATGLKPNEVIVFFTRSTSLSAAH